MTRHYPHTAKSVAPRRHSENRVTLRTNRNSEGRKRLRWGREAAGWKRYTNDEC